MSFEEAGAIHAAKQELGRALARVCDEHAGRSEAALQKLFTPGNFDVEYTSKKGRYWLVVLDWNGPDPSIENLLTRMFGNQKFDVIVHSFDMIEIPDIEAYLNRPEAARQVEPKEVDLSDLPYEE